MVIFKNLPTTQYIEVMHAGNIIDSVYLRRGIVLLDNYDQYWLVKLASLDLVPINDVRLIAWQVVTIFRLLPRLNFINRQDKAVLVFG